MKILLLVGALSLFAACGGNSSKASDARVLHLRTGDYTEAQYRANLRSSITTAGCTRFKDLDAKAVAGVIAVDFTKEPDKSRIVQQSTPADDLRQAEIQLEECARIK